MSTAAENALVQRENPKIATRILDNGTKINMYFGNTVIPGTLNDSETAQALIKILPCTITLTNYGNDFAVLWTIRSRIRRKMYTTVGLMVILILPPTETGLLFYLAEKKVQRAMAIRSISERLIVSLIRSAALKAVIQSGSN